MKTQRIFAIIAAIAMIMLSSCKGNIDDISSTQDSIEKIVSFTDDSNEISPNQKEEKTMDNYITIKVGQNTLAAVLEDNDAGNALAELLKQGDLTISASNYGGFEKVCSLGKNLPKNDKYTTTQAGDIMLYNGNQIVIFYGQNSWSYTKLGKVINAEQKDLEKILSGKENKITISAADK